MFAKLFSSSSQQNLKSFIEDGELDTNIINTFVRGYLTSSSEYIPSLDISSKFKHMGFGLRNSGRNTEDASATALFLLQEFSKLGTDGKMILLNCILCALDKTFSDEALTTRKSQIEQRYNDLKKAVMSHRDNPSITNWKDGLLDISLTDKLKTHFTAIEPNFDAGNSILFNHLRFKENSSQTKSAHTITGSSFATSTPIQSNSKEAHVLDACFSALTNDGYVIALGDGCGGHFGEALQDEAIARASYFGSKHAARLMALFDSDSLTAQIPEIINQAGYEINRKVSLTFRGSTTTLTAARVYREEDTLRVIGFSIGDSMMVAWNPTTQEFLTLAPARQIITSTATATAQVPGVYKEEEIICFDQRVDKDFILIPMSDGVYENLSYLTKTGTYSNKTTYAEYHLDEKEMADTLSTLGPNPSIADCLNLIASIAINKTDNAREALYETVENIKRVGDDFTITARTSSQAFFVQSKNFSLSETNTYLEQIISLRANLRSLCNYFYNLNLPTEIIIGENLETQIENLRKLSFSNSLEINVQLQKIKKLLETIAHLPEIQFSNRAQEILTQYKVLWFDEIVFPMQAEDEVLRIEPIISLFTQDKEFSWPQVLIDLTQLLKDSQTVESINQFDPKRRITPLFALIQHGWINDDQDFKFALPCLSLLLGSGASLENACEDQPNIFFTLAQAKHAPKYIEHIINSTPKSVLVKLLNQQDADGNTPLHFAVLKSSCTENVRLLVSAGALADIKNVSGETPLSRAESLGNGEAVSLLQQPLNPDRDATSLAALQALGGVAVSSASGSRSEFDTEEEGTKEDVQVSLVELEVGSDVTQLLHS